MTEKSIGIPGVKELADIANELGIIQAIKSKLVKQPDPAADKLAAALGEIRKIYICFDDVITDYLALTMDPTLDEKEWNRERNILISLEGGRIKARMSEARGHCGKITNIYLRYLSPWFTRVLKENETDQLKAIFRELEDIDSAMILAIDSLSTWLGDEASVTLKLTDNGEFEAAQKRINRARKSILPERKAISAALYKLNTIEQDFMEASGAL
jgi:hypothetical protein